MYRKNCLKFSFKIPVKALLIDDELDPKNAVHICNPFRRPLGGEGGAYGGEDFGGSGA